MLRKAPLARPNAAIHLASPGASRDSWTLRALVERLWFYRPRPDINDLTAHAMGLKWYDITRDIEKS